MSNEIDNRLLALFAEAHETLPSADFMRAFLLRMERARRRRGLQRIGAVALIGVLAAWIMPSVLATTAALMRTAAEQSLAHGALIISPAGWAVSMLIGLFVLLWSGALRRR